MLEPNSMVSEEYIARFTDDTPPEFVIATVRDAHADAYFRQMHAQTHAASTNWFGMRPSPPPPSFIQRSEMEACCPVLAWVVPCWWCPEVGPGCGRCASARDTKKRVAESGEKNLCNARRVVSADSVRWERRHVWTGAWWAPLLAGFPSRSCLLAHTHWLCCAVASAGCSYPPKSATRTAVVAGLIITKGRTHRMNT